MAEKKTLGNYKGKVNDGKTFENPNKDKVRLSSDEEYVFELLQTHIKEGVPNFKGQKVDKVFCIFSDVQNKNEVLIGFRIDNLTWNTDKPDFQSPLITFFDAIKCPIAKPTNGEFPDLSMYLIPGMKFRARVTPILKEGVFTNTYKIELKTVRRWISTDTPAQINSAATQNAITGITDEEAMKSIVQLCKGSTNAAEAVLSIANPELRGKFIALDKAGKIKYPITSDQVDVR